MCNNAALNPSATDAAPQVVGDPTEVALLVAAAKRGLLRDELLKQKPERREVAFDPTTKTMATIHKLNESYLVAVKGAPEAVLADCETQLSATGVRPLDRQRKQSWIARCDQLGARGLRTLALASKTVTESGGDPYTGLTLLGVVGLLDPPRDGVGEAIAACRDAGIRVVMVTGDHPATAGYIAAELGLDRQNNRGNFEYRWPPNTGIRRSRSVGKRTCT